jgi:hypothetical protein
VRFIRKNKIRKDLHAVHEEEGLRAGPQAFLFLSLFLLYQFTHNWCGINLTFVFSGLADFGLDTHFPGARRQL